MTARAHVEARKRDYPRNLRVRAVHFTLHNSSVDDNQTVPPGTTGRVQLVDDAGTVMVAWDNGARLGATVNDRIIAV